MTQSGDFTRLDWNEGLWEEIRENLSRPRPLPTPGSDERMWLDSKPTQRMLLEMVSILDGMERLVSMGEREAMEANPVVRNWLTSIRGLQRRMVRSLEKLGVKAIPSLGRPFDAHIHEAVEVRKDSRYPPGTVVEVREKPFRWGHQTLRVGKVVVTPKSSRISTTI